MYVHIEGLQLPNPWQWSQACESLTIVIKGVLEILSQQYMCICVCVYMCVII